MLEIHAAHVPLVLGLARPISMVDRIGQFDCGERHLAVSAASAARRHPGLPPGARFVAESRRQTGSLLLNKLN